MYTGQLAKQLPKLPAVGKATAQATGSPAFRPASQQHAGNHEAYNSFDLWLEGHNGYIYMALSLCLRFRSLIVDLMPHYACSVAAAKQRLHSPIHVAAFVWQKTSTAVEGLKWSL